MGLHSDRIQTYANEAADVVEGLIPGMEELLWDIPVPADSQIEGIRQTLAETGLPEMEVCLLEGLGYTPQEIDAIEQAILGLPDEHFRNFRDLPETMFLLAAGLRELPGSLTTALPAEALVIGLTGGWNHACYAGPAQPVDEALAGIIENVVTVYRFTPGQGFDRWFPDRPEVSTMTSVSPYNALLVLVAGDTTWAQEDAEAPPESVNLMEGWNSICYTGQTKSADDAISGMAGGFAILYRLADQVWGRFVPGRLEVSSISQLDQYDAVLMLVTAPGATTWVFDP
jgi:hypothetical protein